ncbi:hypothetical protein CYMTET_18242 [Cymbomonas tetramitiformis]|uniref:Uncharacterized protein n=1 Tax=Cymbomonas tetramitiformis TaxID=36881 RepID=A0AAE0G931_9CHLO|nr:hypothetical protein CYMTET_18242 [Cymbomonas tetramitiformis]
MNTCGALQSRVSPVQALAVQGRGLERDLLRADHCLRGEYGGKAGRGAKGGEGGAGGEGGGGGGGGGGVEAGAEAGRRRRRRREAGGGGEGGAEAEA